MFVDASYGINPYTLSTSDFEGSAKFALLEKDVDKIEQMASDKQITLSSKFLETTLRKDFIDIDLLFQEVSFEYAERNKIENYLKDYFSIHFKGKQFLILNLQGTLLDYKDNTGKAHLVELYNKLFRISKVAYLGITPAVYFKSVTAQGAMLGMSLNENSSLPDRIHFSTQFLVFNMYFYNRDNLNKKYTDIVWDNTSKLRVDQLINSKAGPKTSNVATKVTSVRKDSITGNTDDTELV